MENLGFLSFPLESQFGRFLPLEEINGKVRSSLESVPVRIYDGDQLGKDSSSITIMKHPKGFKLRALKTPTEAV